jgi:outer membrane protein TolC
MTRRVTRPTLTLLMILALLPPLAGPGPLAQEAPPATPPAAPGTAPQPEAPGAPAFVLSLQDAVKAALENNLDIVVRAYDPLRSEAQVILAESSFDPLLNGTATSNSAQRPSPSAFVKSSKTHDFLASFVDPILTGGRYQIDLEAFDNTASTILGNTREFDTSWRVSITQPLLRNFGPKATKTFIVEARNTLGISQSRFRSTVIDTLSAAEKAYWDLNFALINLKTSQAALQLAQDFLDQNRIKVRVGTLAPIEITQAEAQVADRDEAVIIAESQVKTAEDGLRRVMNVPKDSPEWSQPILPSDPLPLVEQSPDMDGAVSIALQHRPDLEQARLDLKTKEADLALRRNQRRWGLNLNGSYGKVGIDIDNYGNSIDDLRGGANVDWQVTMALGIPIGNRQAVATFTDSEYALTQARKGLETLELAARVQVRDAVRAVQTTLKRVKAAQVNVRLQREKLSAEQKKFENGMSTSFQVLQFQNDLFTAQVRENLAMVDYNKAQVELERVQGTLLEARRVQMPANDSRRTLPYHPRTRVNGAPGGDRQPAGAASSAGLEGAAPSAGGLPNQFVFEGRRLVARWTDSAQGGPSAP